MYVCIICIYTYSPPTIKHHANLKYLEKSSFDPTLQLQRDVQATGSLTWPSSMATCCQGVERIYGQGWMTFPEVDWKESFHL